MFQWTTLKVVINQQILTILNTSEGNNFHKIVVHRNLTL